MTNAQLHAILTAPRWLLVAIVAALMLVIGFTPWLVFWSVAQVGGPHVAVSLRTWCACWILMLMLRPSVRCTQGASI